MKHTTDGRPLAAWASAAARDFAGLTQDEMADRMTEATGLAWTAVMVRNLERGKRKAKYEDIAAVSDITGFPITWFHEDPTASANVNPGYVSDTYGPNPADLLTCNDDLLVGAGR